MDLTKPIDISAINNTAKIYDKQIRTLNTLDAMFVLKNFGLRTGFKESVDIHEFQNAFGNSKKHKVHLLVVLLSEQSFPVT